MPNNSHNTSSNNLPFFTEILREGAKLPQPKGVALRWAVNADGENGVQLLLQALPAPANIINGRPAFKRDSCPGITVVNACIGVNIDQNPITTGPIPVIFSSNPDTTKKALASSYSAQTNIIKGNFPNANKIIKFQKYYGLPLFLSQKSSYFPPVHKHVYSSDPL